MTTNAELIAQARAAGADPDVLLLADRLEAAERATGALEDMAWQFAYRGRTDDDLIYTTGGLSALEHAFDVLGWDDPHKVEFDGNGCEWGDCGEWVSGGMPTDGGYLRLCSDHLVARSVEGGTE